MARRGKGGLLGRTVVPVVELGHAQTGDVLRDQAVEPSPQLGTQLGDVAELAP
jgi:hypothetical protein